MHRYVLTSAVALALSTGATLAASPNPTAMPVAPAIQGPSAASAYYSYDSGYIFPNDGSPSSEQYMAHPIAQPPHGIYTHVYLYPPAEGDDSNG